MPVQNLGRIVAPFVLGSIATFDPAALTAKLGGEPSKNGIVLENVKVKALVEQPDADGKTRLVEYTVSVYAHREPLTEAEDAACKRVGTTQAESKAKREADEQSKREREIKRASEMGAESIMTAIKNVGAISQGLHILNAANAGK